MRISKPAFLKPDHYADHIERVALAAGVVITLIVALVMFPWYGLLAGGVFIAIAIGLLIYLEFGQPIPAAIAGGIALAIFGLWNVNSGGSNSAQQANNPLAAQAATAPPSVQLLNSMVTSLERTVTTFEKLGPVGLENRTAINSLIGRVKALNDAMQRSEQEGRTEAARMDALNKRFDEVIKKLDSMPALDQTPIGPVSSVQPKPGSTPATAQTMAPVRKSVTTETVLVPPVLDESQTATIDPQPASPLAAPVVSQPPVPAIDLSKPKDYEQKPVPKSTKDRLKPTIGPVSQVSQPPVKSKGAFVMDGVSVDCKSAMFSMFDPKGNVKPAYKANCLTQTPLPVQTAALTTEDKADLARIVAMIN